MKSKILITTLFLIGIFFSSVALNSVSATTGTARMRVYTVVDGRQVPMEGVVISVFTPINNFLWGTPYDSRGGRHAYVVTSAHGDVVFGGSKTGQVGNCSGFASYTLTGGVHVFGGSMQGMNLGGIPVQNASRYGRATGDGQCTPGNGTGVWNDPNYPPNFEWGYMNDIQCVTALFTNYNRALPAESYRFVPYFPAGYRNAFLANNSNLALRTLRFSDSDLKGGGMFIPRRVVPSQALGGANGVRFDQTDIQFSGVVNFQSSSATYRGINSTNQGVSESLFFSTANNNQLYEIEWEWVPADEPLPTPTPTLEPTATPTPTPTPSITNTPTPTPTGTLTPTPTLQPTATPTPTLPSTPPPITTIPITQIPNTAIFDDERANVISIGLFLILLGIVAYRYKFGSSLFANTIERSIAKFDKIIFSTFSYDRRVLKKKNLERKKDNNN